jgi:hypothetical protein
MVSYNESDVQSARAYCAGLKIPVIFGFVALVDQRSYGVDAPFLRPSRLRPGPLVSPSRARVGFA